MSLWKLAPALVFVFFVSLPTAFADVPKVYLNGVDISGVSDQEFEGATVRIDATGNIHIIAPQYKVEVQNDNKPAGTTPANASVAVVPGHYFIVGSNTKPGSTQFDIDIYINGALFKTMKNNEGQLVAEISEKLIKGTNTVTFRAKKLEGARISASPTDTIDLFVGKGSANGNQLEIEKQFLSFKIDASQMSDKTENFTFQIN